MADDSRKIDKLNDEELVDMAGHTVPGGLPSGESTHAQAELSRRLMETIKTLDESTSKYSKAVIALTFVLLVIGIIQVIITVLGSPAELWQRLAVLLVFVVVIAWTFRRVVKDFFE